MIAKARKNKKGGGAGPKRTQRFQYLEEANLGGNDCGGELMLEAHFGDVHRGEEVER